jgi:hypothetical protein
LAKASLDRRGLDPWLFEIEHFMTTSESEYELTAPPTTAGPARAVVAVPAPDPIPAARPDRFRWVVWLAIVGLCLSHSALIWVALGGWTGLTNGWPILQADHGIHYRNGLLMAGFLKSTGMTAGYDPGFMSGYPMSIVSDLSSTFSAIVMLATGDRPALGSKLHVLFCASACPSLIALACLAWRVKPAGVLVAVSMYLTYFWIDFSVTYVYLGMLNYLVSIPLGLLCLAALTGYLEHGGLGRWVWGTISASAVFLVHLTSPLLLVPAGLTAYGVAIWTSRRSGQSLAVSRHLGLWGMVPVVVVLNLFWLWPGFLLRETKGPTNDAFVHKGEWVHERLGQIFWNSPPIQGALIALVPLGLVVLARRRPVVAAGLGGFLAAGFSWGYLAGMVRMVDSLQPGRQTYAFYSSAAVFAGIGLAEVFDRLRAVKLEKWFALALVVGCLPILYPTLDQSFRARIFSRQPLLSSQPSAQILAIIDQIQKTMKPGERLLFEETGKGFGVREPYEGRHYSPILPSMANIEVIGGPYLHSTVTTNFTQFGENKLFENPNWNLDFFVRYAKLYRPSAICCWSPKARAFCLSNPDLIKVETDDGVVLFGRIIGFEGSTIRGKATVEASPNRLVVRDALADPEGGGDGLVVLRYHAVPYLKASPQAEIIPVKLEDDPIPFIGIRPTAGPLTIEMVLPPRR